ncbi:MAG TPA: histidine kinase, partial [Clostridiaceae bacterium]|nr:histidine kinase [Clostridiaceae bacterium]
IEKMCNNVSLGKRGYIYIIDKYGNMVYHPQQQMIYAGLKTENTMDALTREPGTYFEDFDGERRIMTIKNVSYSGWRIVGISYVDELVTNRKHFNRFIMFISIFGVIFEMMASMFISYKISQPVKRLENKMKRLENGDFNISVEEKGEDEVRQLSRTFNMMVGKIKMLMDQIITEQEEKRKSELKALQAQINPHFLYNTLDSIIWMNENQNYEGVTVMVSALSKLFRISLSKGQEVISIADELEHARSYLTIQKMRYKDKYDYFIDIEPGLESERTLKLILQPIVENAIYHGIGPLNEKGIIRISVKSEGDNILFQVTDNGYGIKPEILKNLLSQESTSYHSGGVGLKNVNERIKLFYGEEYGIEILSEVDVGTTVNIRIPRKPFQEGR